MRLFIFLFVFLQTFTGCGQEPELRYTPAVDTLSVQLGDAMIRLQVYRYNDTLAPFFVHLHHNEQTADSVLHHVLQRNGGAAVHLRNNLQRLVSFSLQGTRYAFDPNRMFTEQGLEHSMKLLGPFKKAAADSVAKLSGLLLSLLPDSLPLIAMHNNTDGAYSFLSYQDGGVFAPETKASFRNAEMDTDDFILTTDAALFDALKRENLNVILQDNEKAFNDGSLSYYLGKQNRTYINIEAEHGHFSKQLDMLQQLLKILARSNNR